MSADDDRGVLHRHADGRVHRHFRAGFEIGGQVIADQDGTETHSHGLMRLGSGGKTHSESGPVVWTELDGYPTECRECGIPIFTGNPSALCAECYPEDDDPTPVTFVQRDPAGPTVSEIDAMRDAGRIP